MRWKRCLQIFALAHFSLFLEARILSILLMMGGAFYFLIDSLLFTQFRIHFRPSLVSYLFHNPASFRSSLKCPPLRAFLSPLFLSLVVGSGLFLFCPEEVRKIPGIWLWGGAALSAFWWRQKKPQQVKHHLFEARPFEGKRLFSLRAKNPHIVFLILESFRAKNVGCLGAKIPLSPRFDALAKEGILFSQFHATGNLTCRATIASLFGIQPAPQNWHLSRYTPLSFIGLPQILREIGYETALMQGGHLSFDSAGEFFQKKGFQTVLGKREIGGAGTSWGVFDEQLMEKAATWLNEREVPSFLTVFTITNHHPWTSPPSWAPPPLAKRDPYLKTFSYTDACLGRFIDRLEKGGILDHCLLFIFGDHGQSDEEREAHYEINRSLYQENLHVPLLLYGKGMLDAPRTIDTVASQIDLLPTVLDLLHIPKTDLIMGKSLAREEERGPIFFSDAGIQGIRFENWKYCTGEERGEELYDLSCDPLERSNLLHLRPDLVQKAKEDLSSYFSSVEALYTAFPKKEGETSPSHLALADSLSTTDESLGKEEIPSLTSLSLSHCLLVTDRGIRSLLARCPDLEALSVEGMDELRGEKWPPLEHLVSLHALDCPLLQGENWIRWIGALPSLRNLQLDASSLTDEELLYLAEKHTQLWTLRIAGSPFLTDRGLAALLRVNPLLRSLYIEDCPQVGDASLYALQGRVLRSFAISRSEKVTNEGIQSLSRFCLKHLFLCNCPLITAEGVAPLREKKDLEILF